MTISMLCVRCGTPTTLKTGQYVPEGPKQMIFVCEECAKHCNKSARRCA